MNIQIASPRYPSRHDAIKSVNPPRDAFEDVVYLPDAQQVPGPLIKLRH